MPRTISFNNTPLTTIQRKGVERSTDAVTNLRETREAGASRAAAQPEAREVRDALVAQGHDHRTAQSWAESINRHAESLTSRTLG